jgi:ureidoglycolate hydrolase
MAEIRDLAIAGLSAAAFAPYGTVIPPMADGTAFGPQEAALQLSAGIPRFYTMRLPNRGLLISRITRHRQVTQVLASAGGLPWMLAVAPPPAEDTQEARPALDDIRAFRVPGNVAVMLRRGAWHAGPLFEAAEASFFNLELSDTNVTDHWTCDLARTYGVSFRLALV